eukprot:9061251-Alexandrium_andersonii.AAC.1
MAPHRTTSGQQVMSRYKQAHQARGARAAAGLRRGPVPQRTIPAQEATRCTHGARDRATPSAQEIARLHVQQ